MNAEPLPTWQRMPPARRNGARAQRVRSAATWPINPPNRKSSSSLHPRNPRSRFHAEYKFSIARVLSAVFFQEKPRAICKPSSWRLSRSLADHAAAPRRASAQSQTEAAGTYIGASPHTSRCAGISEMTQGHPHAMASKGGSPNPSYTVAETKACAAE
jgi:hypothetical protein